ncbi:argininosuccinate synthase, partial [Microbacteriaceae bacterium K1510]|nr:argininosuccinate synthase [Microbacteriaceae bacterium K1510]
PKPIKKVVLAYSGGLDTSIILKWLQQTYGAEVVTFTADLGQGGELDPACEKALMLGIKPQNIYIEDLREEVITLRVTPPSCPPTRAARAREWAELVAPLCELVMIGCLT